MNIKYLKVNLIFSFIMIGLIDLLLSIVLLLEGIDLFTYISLVVCLFIWPSTILYEYRACRKRVHSNKQTLQREMAPVKLSIIIWLILVSALILFDYFSDKNITWAYYPTAGITLWPIGMLIYNYIAKKVMG